MMSSDVGERDNNKKKLNLVLPGGPLRPTPMTRVMKVKGNKTHKMKVLWHFGSQLSTRGACGVAYAYWWWLATHRHKNN